MFASEKRRWQWHTHSLGPTLIIQGLRTNNVVSASVACCFAGQNLGGCLVRVFKQQFSVFKNSYSIFTIIFNLYVFLQHLNNDIKNLESNEPILLVFDPGHIKIFYFLLLSCVNRHCNFLSL